MTYDLNDPFVRVVVVGFIISLPFKVVGIWRAAKNSQKGWFAVLLLLNTVGILDLIYLFYFSNIEKKQTD